MTSGDMAGIASLGHDIIPTDTLSVAGEITGVADDLKDPSVWPVITKALYGAATDQSAAIHFLQNAKAVLKVASVVGKVLEAYDAANVKIPFFL